MLIDIAVAALLVIAGLINIAPGIVALSPRRAEALYGTAVVDRDLTLLLRHRAILLATVGAGLLIAAFVPSTRPVTIGAGLVSMGSFLVLAVAAGPSGLSTKTRRIAYVDVGAIALTVVAVGLLAIAD